MPATTVCPKTLRRLTRGQLKNPDPTAWLVIADYLEECGDDVGAKQWRRRVKYFPVINECVEYMAGADCLVGTHAVVFLCLDGSISWGEDQPNGTEAVAVFRRTERCVHVGAGGSLPPAIISNLWKANRGDQQYYTRHIFHLIEEIHVREQSKGWKP